MGDEVAWNYFRYIADYSHFAGMCLGLATVVLTKSVEGFSRKTQVIYQLVFITRYLDIFVESQVMYLLFFKVAFNIITFSMLVSFAMMYHTYDEKLDSCNLVAILFPTAAAALLTSSGSGLTEELWTWSEYLEPFALVPQYIVCYKAPKIRPMTVVYVLLVGGYRFFYVCNWIYKRYKWHGAYHDYTSWAGGILECILFADFVIRFLRRAEGASMLGQVVLSIDEGAGKISQSLEMSTIGRRLPYGMSGTATEKEAGGGNDKRQWESSDKRADEESNGLLAGNDDDDDDF